MQIDAPANPSVVGGSPAVVFMVLSILGIATLAYLLLKFDRRVPAIALLVILGLGFFSMLFTVKRERTQQVEEAHRQAELAEVELHKFYAELNQPRIELELQNKSEGSTDESESTEADETSSQPAAKQVKRPAWVDQPPKLVGNVYRKVVVSDPYDTVEAGFRALQQHKLRDAINERLDEIAPNRSRPSLEQLGLGPAFMWREICPNQWVETLDTSVGEMKRVYALVEFDAAADRQIADAYGDYEREFRVREVGGIAGIGLGSLALLFGLLKVDTWTKGYYTKRLFFGVPAVIISFVLILLAA